MAPLLPVLCLAALGGESNATSIAAERLRDMLQRAHDERDGARLVARKLSVESALLPAFIVQDLAHGCANQDMAISMSYLQWLRIGALIRLEASLRTVSSGDAAPSI